VQVIEEQGVRDFREGQQVQCHENGPLGTVEVAVKQRERLTKALFIIAIGVFFCAAYSAMPNSIAMRKAKTTQQSMVAASAVIDMYADENLQYPGPTNGFIRLSEVSYWLNPKPKHFPVRDEWGGPILYWSNGDGYMLVSYGSDRRAEFPYEEYELPYEAAARGRMTIHPAQDIIVVCGGIWQGPVLGERTRSGMTMADLRSISTAIESYSIDNSFYPGTGSSLVELVAIEEDLSPIYFRVLPLEDGWDNPFLYWSDRRGYTIISIGADALADAPYEEWTKEDFMSYEGGEVLEPRLDILLTNGAFTQWHTQRGGGDCH
jgi:type II secretory pathway pseudopilin PulG